MNGKELPSADTAGHDEKTGEQWEDTFVLDLHGYPVWQAVELAEKAIEEARRQGYRFIQLIHGAPDITHWRTAWIMNRGGIKWALRGALSRGDWNDDVYGRRSRRHRVEAGSMTLALRPPEKQPKHCRPTERSME
jgi:hypothetical protein